MSKPVRTVVYILGSLIALGLIAVGLSIINRTGPTEGVDETGPQGTARHDALDALRDLEDRLAAAPIGVWVGERRFELVPATIGFDLDEESVLEAALGAGTPESVVKAARNWLQSGETSLSILGAVDEAALSQVLDHYELTLQTPFEGTILIEGITPVAQYPRSGYVIDRTGAGARISAALFQHPRPESVTLDVVESVPAVPASAVDAALAEAELLLAGPVTLTRTDPDATLVMSRQQLARALTVHPEREPTPRLVVGLDPAVVDVYLEPVRAGFEAPTVNARFVIDAEENISIAPGLPGAGIDAELAARAAEEAARRPTRTSVLPLQANVQPEITAEYLRALGVKEKISEFTTPHPCCQARVNNIQLFADFLDGTIVMPGEVMSLNQTVGRRTSEAGYRPAPTIVRGEITDTVGGGVSQFATTFYNAVFWAGLEIIEHQPHSYYFSRYPQGIEATISWPKPDLIFRNDTAAAVVIKTSYTGTSITVKLFGDNSDREVSARVSGSFSPTEFPTEYLPNPEVMPWEEEVEVQEGADGWSVEVVRELAFTNGRTTTQDWTVRYRPWPRQVEVHPCLLPEDSEDYTGEECPAPPPDFVPDESTTSTTTMTDEPTTTSTTVVTEESTTTSTTTVTDESTTSTTSVPDTNGNGEEDSPDAPGEQDSPDTTAASP